MLLFFSQLFPNLVYQRWTEMIAFTSFVLDALLLMLGGTGMDTAEHGALSCAISSPFIDL